jgi:hypothetical protein
MFFMRSSSSAVALETDPAFAMLCSKSLDNDTTFEPSAAIGRVIDAVSFEPSLVKFDATASSFFWAVCSPFDKEEMSAAILTTRFLITAIAGTSTFFGHKKTSPYELALSWLIIQNMCRLVFKTILCLMIF